MNRLPMSRAASGLLRAILKRAGHDSDRILLTEIRSTDWRSLTLEGERHVIELRVAAPGTGKLLVKLTGGIEEAEFAIPGQIVADIAVASPPLPAPDGSVGIVIEALTIAE
jgi:hypothetical protein